MVMVVGDEKVMTVVELNCETEPVSQLDNFRQFGQALADQAHESAITSVDELKALGVARISVGGSIARAAYTLARKAAEEMRDGGTFRYTENTYSNPELNALLGRDD